MKLTAIIPAAGKGSRFGMPKVDALYNGIAFSQMIINTLSEAGIENYVLVRDVETPDMLASVRWGMQKALSEQEYPDGWIVWPVDHPTVKATTILTLKEIFTHKSNSVIVPRHQGRGGHPVMLPGAFSIPDKPNPLGLKGVIMESHFPLVFADVDDVGILFNFNTPEDVHYA
jgi:CTP:molybdopterin cytidylyltransferase MocA